MNTKVLQFSVVLWLGICLPATAVIHKLTDTEYDRLPPLSKLDEYGSCLRARGDRYCYVTDMSAERLSRAEASRKWQINGTLASSDTEYDRLPPLSKLDEYGSCLRARGDRYCYVTAKLFGHNDLFKTIQEYSAANKTHFDHTFIRRGVCVQSSCGKYLENSTDLTTAIEACLNDTMTRDYQLTTRVIRSLCSEYSKDSRWDETDYAFGAVILVLLGLNVLGSVYAYYATNEKKSFGGKLLYSFSMKRNWSQLVAPNSDVKDPMLRRLKCLYCFRATSTFFVVLAHTGAVSIISANNPIFIEGTYDHLPSYILYCGSVSVQTFFLMSGFLMAYNILTSKSRAQWWMLPKKVLLRWLRLTPPYALVMFFVMTWARHVGDGPFWKPVVTAESDDCRRDWWLHLLYIHNYFDHSQCMGHAWYLAADMQLSVLGLVIFCVCSRPRARQVAVAVVFLAGLLTPAAHTVLQKLNPILVVSPQTSLDLFLEDTTFNKLYKRSHTNLVCYAMGMGLAFVVHNVKAGDIGSEKYKKFRLLYVMALPLEVLVILSGAVFYMPDVQVPVALGAVYSSAIRPVFGLIVTMNIFFTIVKVERVCRSFLHWGGWAVLARLSYCAYVVHVTILRTAVASNDMLSRTSLYSSILNFMSAVLASFLLAAAMNLLVEAPAGHVVKLCLDSKKLPSNSAQVAADLASSKETVHTVEIKL